MTDIELKREARRKDMLESKISRIIPVVALPMVITMLIDSFYNMADTFFVSQLGVEATAAVGINDVTMHLIRCIAMGFGMGAASYISRLLGSKRHDEASRVGTTTLITSFIFMILLGTGVYIRIGRVVEILGATQTIKPYCIQYARFILFAAPFTAGEVVLNQLLRSEGSTVYSMVGMCSGCIINLFLDPLFINALGMGVAGAACATAISKVVSFTILLTPFLRRKSLIELRLKLFTPKAWIYKEVVRMGVPTVLRTGSMLITRVLLNHEANNYGDVALAAISVASKCTHIVGSAILGFTMGFQPVAGYCWGARRYKRILDAFKFALMVGIGAILILGSVVVIFAPQLISVFSSKGGDIVPLGVLALRTQCYSLACHMWVQLMSSLYQSIGRAVNSAIIGLSRQVLCFIPLLYILSALFGAQGVACTQGAADVLSMLLSLPFFFRIHKELIELDRKTRAESELAV